MIEMEGLSGKFKPPAATAEAKWKGPFSPDSTRLSLGDHEAPPIDLTRPDPDCDLDYVSEGARKKALDVVISNSFGFGGANTTRVLKRFDG